MRTPATGPHKTEWKIVAVVDADPLAFASKLEQTLQFLTDNDFQIVSQMLRGEALLITAHRCTTAATAPTIPAPENPRRRVVELPAQAPGSTHEEVLYHYVLTNAFGEKSPFQRVFTNMPEALRLVSEHIMREDILPVSLVTTMLTTFEPAAFPMLLKTFAEDIHDELG